MNTGLPTSPDSSYAGFDVGSGVPPLDDWKNRLQTNKMILGPQLFSDLRQTCFDLADHMRQSASGVLPMEV